MKKPAEFTDEEAKVLELLINRRISSFDGVFSAGDLISNSAARNRRNAYVRIREKIWAQLHGTCAADVD